MTLIQDVKVCMRFFLFNTINMKLKNIPQGQYEFNQYEQDILKYWLAHDFYSAEYDPKTKTLKTKDELKSDPRKPWSLICPPPNVLDRPHMGNLSGYVYQDALARFHRMKGEKVLMIPGKDHAGIEAEVTYIKYFLEANGKSKFDFTREDFYAQMMKWSQGLVPTIQADEKLVGLSADFNKDLHTLDPRVVGEVLETFSQMYKDGLIYKGVRIVNWDPKSQSAISDSQCERKQTEGKLYYIKYKLKDSEGFVTVATTRPETIFGDTALVVNPSDERSTSLLGKKGLVPLTNREIPIITSGRIEIGFGTGVLKLTPAHAPDDYEIMQEWNSSIDKLERDNPSIIDPAIHVKVSYLNIIDKKTKLCGPVPEKYIGLKANAAREVMVEDLRSSELLEKEEDITQNLLISERTGATIEPIMSSQWFVDVSLFKQKLIDIVANGEVNIYPKYAERKYFSWVENLRDWAISRNLWWGYRLPVWYKGKIEERINDQGKVELYLNNGENTEPLDPSNPEHMKVQAETPGDGWYQDEDILDTWFSSGQWPYLCLKTYDLLDEFYPTDVMVSGYDLLIKWDLTMLLFGLYKTNNVPFKNLYLTGLVKGTDGQKMSKSKRNFLPIDDAKDQYGIDSFRMNCFYQNKAGKAYAMTPQTLKTFRNFNNKLWNGFKYVLISADASLEKFNLNYSDLDEMILLNETFRSEENRAFAELIKDRFEKTGNYLEKFRFGIATEKLYHSFWHEFCDVYLEQSKELLKSEDKEIIKETLSLLLASLKLYIKMLHPFIPFITEKLYQILKENELTTETADALMYTDWKLGN